MDMPYSLLDHINPVTLHVFYVSLFQVTGVLLLLTLLGWFFWRVQYGIHENLSSDDRLGNRNRDYPRGYRILWWGLGLLWLIDGLLQAQPPMATSMFVDMDVAVNMHSQPHWLIVLLGAGIQLWTTHQIASAIFSVLIQVFIGVGMLLGYGRRLGRIALYVSLAWGIPVWIYGEGLGNLFASGASWLTGTPGAVVFYILGAIGLLLPVKFWQSGQIRRYSGYAMAGIWLLLALFQAMPGSGYWSSTGLYNVFRNNTLMPQPGVILAPIAWMMHQSSLQPILYNGIMVGVMAYLGLAMLLNKTGKTFWIVNILWLLATWWLGQDFGIIGGVGTDPQSAPLALLFMVGAWHYGVWTEGNSSDKDVIRTKFKVKTLSAFAITSTGIVTAVFLFLGFAVPQVVVAQGDSPAPARHHALSKKPSTHSSNPNAVKKPAHPQKWLQYNVAHHQVHLLLAASVNQFGSLAFDGYANGFLTVTIPQGWTVDATFVNNQVILKNSAMIVPILQMQKGGPFTPAFPGAFSPNPSQGVKHGVVQHFHFVATHQGRYAVISAVPDGQSSSGMWDYILVKNVSKPSIRIK